MTIRSIIFVLITGALLTIAVRQLGWGVIPLWLAVGVTQCFDWRKKL